MRRVELSKPPIAREVANYQTTVGLVLPGIGSEKFYLSSSALSDCSKKKCKTLQTGYWDSPEVTATA